MAFWRQDSEVLHANSMHNRESRQNILERTQKKKEFGVQVLNTSEQM